MSETYEIPASDSEEFFKLPMQHQKEIRVLLAIIWAVDHAPHKTRLLAWLTAIHAGQAELSSKGISTVLKRQTLYNWRAKFKAAGEDWAALVDKRKAPEWDPETRTVIHARNTGFTDDFLDYLAGLVQRQNRSSEQAIDELLRNWRAGEHVPGYGTWSSWFAREFPDEPMPAAAPIPAGWSRSSLRRFFPKKPALELARRGMAAGVAQLPAIIRTREGLRPLEYVVFDDWRCDFMVFVPGVQQAVELHGILAEDVACATALRYGLRPALPRTDGSDEGLKRVDTKSLAVDLLLHNGYPLDYVSHWIVENGTATITPDDARAIEEVTNGQVKIHYTSMISGRVFGWADRPIGDFRGKSWLESFFNLLHNACGNIPGQIGAHYEQRPKSLPARDAELKALVKAESALPTHLRDTLNYRMPFPHIRDAKSALDFIFHFLNNRDHHACEAFEEIVKVRLSAHDPWRPMAELIVQGHSPEALLALGPRPFIETPAERQTRLRRGVRFGRIPMSAMPLLLTDHREVCVEAEGEINLGSKKHPLIYRARRNPHLELGRKFLAYTSTTDPAWAHLTDGRRYICSVPRSEAIAMTDAEAVSREIGEKAGQLRRLLKGVQRVDLEAQQRRDDLDHNLRLAEQQVAAQTTALVPTIDVEATEENELVGALTTAEGALAAQGSKREAVARFRPANLLEETDEGGAGESDVASGFQPADLR